MKLSEFLKGYDEIATDKLKKDYLNQKIEVVDYIPFNKKLTLAKKLIDVTGFVTKRITDENGNEKVVVTAKIHQNSPARYLLINRILIEQYTNLEFENDQPDIEYDELRKRGLFDAILAMIPESDCDEFLNVVKLVEGDIAANELNPGAYISNQIEVFAKTFGTVALPVLEKLNNFIQNLNEEDIDRILNNLDKVKNLDNNKFVKLFAK